jgi:hypothetical protein
MGTVRIDRCPDCGVMVGEGLLYEHRMRTHPKPCGDGKHQWPADAADGDTCNCGQWYRFPNRIEESLPHE